MVTITDYTLTETPRDSQTLLSADAAATDVVEMVSGDPSLDETVIPPWLTHCFLSIRFFDSGGLPVTPSGGTLAIEIQTLGNQPNWEDPPEASIDATVPTTIDWAANTNGIRVTPTALTGVDHWAVFVTLNKT